MFHPLTDNVKQEKYIWNQSLTITSIDQMVIKPHFIQDFKTVSASESINFSLIRVYQPVQETDIWDIQSVY